MTYLYRFNEAFSADDLMATGKRLHRGLGVHTDDTLKENSKASMVNEQK